MRAGRDLAAALNGHPLPRNCSLFHHEGNEAASGPFGLDPSQFLRPGEVRLNGADPAKPGRDRVRVGADVVAVQGVADLETERVAGAEACRLRPALDNPVPQLGRVLGRNHQLDASLACVAGPVDHAGDSVDLTLRERERRRVGEAEPFQRARPLNGQKSVLIGNVPDVRAGKLAFLQPFEVGLPVRGVDDEEVTKRGELVDDQVVDDPSGLVREQGVLRSAVVEALDVVREDRLQERTGARAFDLELSHVRDVEDAAVRPHRLVLGNHPLVLDGHFPAREGNHARPEGDMTVVNRRPQKGLHPGGDAKGSRPGPPAKARGRDGRTGSSRASRLARSPRGQPRTYRNRRGSKPN